MNTWGQTPRCPPGQVWSHQDQRCVVLKGVKLGPGHDPIPQPTPTPSPTPGLRLPRSCVVNGTGLDAWGKEVGVFVFYLPQTPAPLTKALLDSMLSTGGSLLYSLLAAGKPAIFVMADGSFWAATYSQSIAAWLPAPAPAQKALYCTWQAKRAR